MAENLSLVAQLFIDRTKALEAIQELHVPNVRSSTLSLCYGCLEVWPCDTRRLADQGLGDNLARTTKNGENNA